MDVSQNNKDFFAEGKKTALLEQCLREMESALAARTIPKPLIFAHSLPLAKSKSINITTPATNQDANLVKKNDSQLNLPPAPDDISAKVSSITTGDKDGWH